MVRRKKRSRWMTTSPTRPKVDDGPPLAAQGDTARGRSASAWESTDQRFERIHREMRERICRLRYPPGTILSEQQLAQEFGVSRTPIRRVLLRLSFDGLVEIKNGVGTIVTQIDLKTFKEISELRMALADLMGRLSSGPVPRTEIERAERLLERARALRANPDYDEYACISNELADVLLGIIRNRPLREIMDILHYRVARTWFSLLPSLEWNDVVDALEEEISQTLEAMKRDDIGSVGTVRHYFMERILVWISEYLTKH